MTGAFGAVGTAGADGKPGLTGASGAVGTAGADGKPGLTGASGLLLESTSVMNQSRGFVYIVQPSEIFGDSANTTWTYLGARATELVGALPSKIGMFFYGFSKHNVSDHHVGSNCCSRHVGVSTPKIHPKYE